MEKPREIAAEVLNQHRKSDQFLETLFSNCLHSSRLSSMDSALCQELVYGVVRWQSTLDWIISLLTTHPPGRAQVTILLRLGIYQVLFLDRIPAHAAVHETVAVARKFRLSSQTGFINAILRRVVREQDQLRQRLFQLQSENPALAFSHPEWLVNHWLTRWPRENVIGLLKWNNQPPPTFARLNTLKCSREQLLQAWQKEDVSFQPVTFPWAKSFSLFKLESHPSLATLRSFQEGCFYIQDPSTLLAVEQVNAQADERILDLCAAPGGKTTAIAQGMGNRGLIVAEDLAPERLRLVEENVRRLGATCVHVGMSPDLHAKILVKKGGEPSPTPTQRFDRILVDAPCSNTGVLRRRVDLRWRIKLSEIKRLQEKQGRLLEQAAKRLCAGGMLVYSTCSLEPEENQEVIKKFLEENKNFQLESEHELTPFRDAVDGAYVARMKSSDGK